NPYDIHQVADSLHTGLTMSLEERVERWQRMMTAVREHDVRRWKERFLAFLEEPGGDRRG
ncbi:MAG TPA: trehalose-6-phosphate synthase, partial [Rhodospirillales bacterium]|nr:trehalose-6-phosphate synthase [Rhodospirillales bacterium]